MKWLKRNWKRLSIGIAATFLVLLVINRLDIFSLDFITGFAEISMALTIFVILLLYALQGAVMIVPTGLLYIAAGLAFPTWIGLIVTYAGLTVSLTIGYLIGKRMGLDKVGKALAKNKKISDFLNGSKDNLLMLSFISRILPTPFGLVSLFFGAVKVPYVKYIFMSLLGLSPFMVPVVFAGAAVTNPFSAAFLVPFGVSLGITGIILVVYKAKLVTKTRITVLLVIAQILLFGGLINRMANAIPIITIAIYVTSILMVLWLVKKNEAAAYKVVWIIIIITLPIAGVVIYLLFGLSHPTKRVKAHTSEHAVISPLLANDVDMAHNDCDKAGLMHYVRSASSYCPYEDTKTQYFPLGEDMFAAMLEELAKAERFIFMEYFIIARSYMWDKILEILQEKAAAGVEVRLIFDDIGSLGVFNSAYLKELSAKGIKIMRFNPFVPFISPFMNYRNHRKIMVIDGNTAFTGGINISDEYINRVEHWGTWKDTGIMLKGDAVWSFTLMFIETWNAFSSRSRSARRSKDLERISDFEAYKGGGLSHDACERASGLVLPYGDTPLGNERIGENIYIDILTQAQRYVYIFSPYLIISEKMIHALQMAARRGVDVRIVTPGKADKWIVHRATRSYYPYLLEAGVKIYEFTPGFLHAKSFVCDDKVAVIGSINLDYRSLYLHFECAVLLYQTDTIADLFRDAQQTIAQSQEVLPKKQRWFGELFDAILHLFAPVM